MDKKLKNTIDKIVQLSRENIEFGAELRKRLGVSAPKKILSLDGGHIEQIYEYCIEEVVKCQAEEFYSDFPIKDIVPELVKDFCRMESFRRKDCFGDFCLAVYQQLECIANKLCGNEDLIDIAKHMWGYPANVAIGKGITPSMKNRWENGLPIANFVFGKLAAFEKSEKSLQSLYAMDKLKVIVYFVGYKTMISNNNTNDYWEYITLLSDIYQCRNTNHRGCTLEAWQQCKLDKVLAHKSVYYFKFLGALTQFIEMIKDGWAELPAMRQYAIGLPERPVKEVTAPTDGK